MENTLTFAQQAERYMLDIAREARPNTLHVYRSLLNRRILPIIGGERLEAVDNLTAKVLVGRLTEAKLSPATINLAVTLVKQVVKSAVDERGNCLFPRVWNPDFIKTPKIDLDAQKAPITPSGTLQEALGATIGELQALVAILASSGLRVGECLAIGQGNVWDPLAGTITVNGTMIRGKWQDAPKTRAGKRVVDIPVEIGSLLRLLFANRESSVLFPLSEDSYRRRITALGIEGFHALRRFRVTHLQLANVPEPLIKFWAGHAGKDVTARYTKVGNAVAERREWSEKAGLGFTI